MAEIKDGYYWAKDTVEDKTLIVYKTPGLSAHFVLLSYLGKNYDEFRGIAYSAFLKDEEIHKMD